MLLVIDNYDSFSYKRVQRLGEGDELEGERVTYDERCRPHDVARAQRSVERRGVDLS